MIYHNVSYLLSLPSSYGLLETGLILLLKIYVIFFWNMYMYY